MYRELGVNGWLARPDRPLSRRVRAGKLIMQVRRAESISTQRTRVEIFGAGGESHPTGSRPTPGRRRPSPAKEDCHSLPWPRRRHAHLSGDDQMRVTARLRRCTMLPTVCASPFSSPTPPVTSRPRAAGSARRGSPSSSGADRCTMMCLVRPALPKPADSETHRGSQPTLLSNRPSRPAAW